MKKVLTTLLLLVALVLPRAVWAQGQLTVCNGSATNNNVPFYGYYYDSPNNWTQSIYPDSLFTDVRGESIYQMAWYPSSGGDQVSAFAQPVTVKLGVLHSQSAFSGTTAVPADSLTLVWTGLLSGTYDNGMIVITFDTPFAYPADGGNLVVEFCKAQSGTYKQIYFNGMSTGYDASLRSYSGGNYSLQPFLAKVTLSYGAVPECDRPASTALVEANAYDATVSWTPVADANSYELVYATESFSADTLTNNDYAYDTFYTFSGLSANTMYYYAVRANCSDNSFWRYGSFRTACVPMESTDIPYFDNFEAYASGAMPACWNSISSVSGYPQVYNDAYNAHSGSNMLRLCSSSGSYGYAILPPLDASLNASDMQLRFFAKGDNGLSFEVGVMDNPADASTFTQLGSATVTATYQEFEMPLNAYEGTGAYVAIRVSTPASYYYVYIDDLYLENVPTCIRPVEAHCVATTADEATISWTAADDNSSEFTLFWGPNADMSNLIDSMSVNDTVETITDLAPMTTYYAWVRTDCGSESSNLRPVGSFTTQCAPMPTSALPYTQGFDGYTSSGNQPVPQCWEKILASADGANPCPYNGNAHNGSYAISFYKGGGGENLLAMPQFEGLDQLAVTFWAFKGNNNGFCDLFVVGVMEGTTFVGVDTIPLTTSYAEYTVSFTDYTGTGNTPAFYCRSNSGDLRATLDQVTVDFAPQCLNPYGVQALGTTTTGAMLSWNGDDNLTYEVAYDTVAMTNSDLENASVETAYGTTITLAGLEAAHTYHVYVRSDCGGGAYSNWAYGTFQTERCDDGCDITINMHDSYGDGWNGGGITVWQGDVNLGSCTLPISTSNGTATYHVCPNDSVYFMFSPGSYPSEISFEILDANENDLYTSTQGALTASGQFFAWVPSCVAPTCPRPANAVVGAVTAYTADLTWVDGDLLNPVGDYMVIYGTVNDPAQATDSVEFYTTTGQLTGLSASTTYYAWVHAVCGGEISQDRAFGSFSTNCAPIATLPFSENFDNLTGTGNMAWPACWSRISGDGDNPCPNYSTDHSHSGTNAVSMWTDGSHSYANLFALPEFEEDLNQLQVSFWAQLWFATGVEHFIVGVMEGTTFVPVDTVPLTVGYSEYTVSFADYEGTSHRPAFYGKNMSGQELRVNVDDIVVDYIPACARPTNVVMTGRGATSIDVAWSNDGAAGYDIFWSTSANDVPYDMMSVTDTFATLTGLDTNTNYYVYVRANCGNAYSEWTIPSQMKTFLCDAPCDILVTFESTAEWGTAWNAMYIYMGGQELAKIMGNYTASNPYHVGVCPSTPIVLARECYHSSHASNVTSTVTTLYDEVLATMPLGTSCGVNQMIVIDTFTTTCAAPTCFNPLNVTASAIDSVSATITWSDDIASLWQLEYGPAGFAQGNGTVVNNLTTQSYTITGLNPNTAYDVYVSTVCTDTVMTAPVCHFRTACGIILMLPYSEDFETYNEGQIPTCWEQIHNQGNNPCVSAASSGLCHSGTHLISFWHNVAGNQNTIATPNFGDLTGKQLSFWARTNNGVPQFSVGVIDNQGNYIALDSNFALTTTYQEFTIDLTPWATFGSRVAFHTLCTSNNTQQVYIDDVTIGIVPDCPVILSISANTAAATTSSVEIAWTDTANTAWEYIYDVMPINNDALYTPTQTTSNPLTLSGLNAATTYHIYVRPVCNGVVPWAYVSTSTLVCDGGCDVQLVMHDSYGDGWNGNAIAVYQNNILMGTATIAAGNANTELVSICPSIPINFTWVTGNFPGETSFEITDAWDNELYTCASGASLTNGATFFTYTSTCSAPTCFRPLNVSAINISGSTATITWFDTMASSWTIAYDSVAFVPGAPNASTQTITSATQSVTLTGLANSTTYYVYVQAQCTDTSIWSDLCFFGTTMCDGLSATTGSGNNAVRYVPGYGYYRYSLSGTIIDAAELADLAGAEIAGFAFQTINTVNGNYFDDCEVYLGHTTDSVYGGEANASTWIFDSSFVKVYEGSLNYTTVGWQSFLFDTAFQWDGQRNLVLVVNRMTGLDHNNSADFAGTDCVGNKSIYFYQDGSTPFDVWTPTPQYATSAGVVEWRANYQLFTCGGGCAVPGNVTATSVDYQSATINWTGSAASYEVAIMNGAVWGTETTVNGFSHTFTGLQPATTYQYRVRAICDEETSSNWAVAFFVTDSLPCLTPENLQATEVTGTTATLTWNALSNETSWQVRYAAQGDTSYATASSTTHLLSGLHANTTYTAWVRALCGDGTVESDWSEPVEFTTIPCPAPSNVTVSNETATGATISWTAPEGYSTFELLYGTEENANSMTPVQVNGTSHTLTGLQTDVRYYVTVRTKCAEGWISDLTPFINFRTVGIDDVDANAITLYPNPATDQVTIQGYEGEVQIVDMTGRTMLRTNNTTIDLSELATGAYFVRMGTTVKKLIVK